MIGYRIWTANNGDWHRKDSGCTVRARHHLGPLYTGSLGTRRPGIFPGEHGLWEKRTAQAVNCSNGCRASPGPCGECGIFLMRTPGLSLAFYDSHLRALPRYFDNCGSMERFMVVGRVEVQGPLHSVAPEHGNRSGVPEWRTASASVQALCIPEDKGHWARPLIARYQVPVHTGVTLENLTNKESL